MKMHENRSATILVWSALIVALLAPAAASAQAECEIPLFVKQNMLGANIMMMADNSTSMNTILLHDDYDKDTAYTGPFLTTSNYFVAKDGERTPSDFSSAFGYSSPSAEFVNSDNGEDGIYAGNYLNWIFFHATDDQRDNVPKVTRIQALKTVLADILDRSDRLNFGITVFSGEKGGNIIGPIGKSHLALQSIIAGITANTWTPLGEAVEDVADYFAIDGPTGVIQTHCQYNFQIVVTDGLPTQDLDVSSYLWDADGDGNDPGSCTSIGSPYPDFYDCSDHFDDVTYYMAHGDLRPDMEGPQNVITYVVGFSEDGQLLQEAAENGNGLFFQAENAAELALSIEYALQDVLRRISAGSAVAVVSTERGSADRLYRGKFMPIDWDGYVECYSLPYANGDAALWEAGDLLRVRSTGTRRIFTALGNTEYEFSASNAATLRDELGVATEAEASDLINWGRGDDVAGYRDRKGWVLGPIVHSTPVVVGPPANFLVTPDYQSFYQANENRRRMIYVGANDGMLHGFDAATGEEVWSFVPELALPAFAAMADSYYCHMYSMDQTVTVKDVQLNGVWRTILVSGGGRGGSSIFALDITVPASPDLLWQADLPSDVKFTSDVEITRIDGEAVALVGSGLDTANMEAWIYGYRVRDGALLGSVMLSQNSKVLRNKATRPVSVDLNLDGQAELVYVADLLGDVYRFDVKGSPDPDSWSMSRLYDGSVEITADPTVAFGPNGAVYVYVGTGAYLEDPDMITVDPQSFLCLFDAHDGGSATKSALKDQSSSINDVSGAKGWYLELTNGTGERVTQPAAVVAETIIFTSFKPSLDPCVAGGESWVYQARYDDGGNTELQDDLSDRSVSIGEGIASYPVIDLSSGNVVVQSSDASINVEPIAAVYQRLNVRAWQENFSHVPDASGTVTEGDVQ